MTVLNFHNLLYTTKVIYIVHNALYIVKYIKQNSGSQGTVLGSQGTVLWFSLSVKNLRTVPQSPCLQALPCNHYLPHICGGDARKL